MPGSWWSPWRLTKLSGPAIDKATTDQPDLFISYSRTDVAYCRQLAATVRAAGRMIWMDEEGISPTEEWLAVIFKAIESCRCFVFVISPASVQSRFCRMELEHAVRHNKKLVPVLWQPVDDAALPDALKPVQWLDAHRYADVSAVGAALLDSADRDADWVAFHTRLLLRALDWDRTNRVRARLLTAGETRDAYASLRQGAGKDPKPTELQEAFVSASRRDTLRIRTVASVLFAVGVAGTLGGIILYRGVEAARASDAQFRTADWAFSDGELPRAITHLMRAISINPSNRDAQDRLYDLLVAQPVLLTRLATKDDPVRAIVFDDKHRRLLAVGESGQGFRLDAGATTFELLETKDDEQTVPPRRPNPQRQLMRLRLIAGEQVMPPTISPLALDAEAGRVALPGRHSFVLSAIAGPDKWLIGPFESTVRSVHFLDDPNVVAVRLATELRLWHLDTAKSCLAVELEEDRPLLMSKNGRWLSVRSDPGGLEEKAYQVVVGGLLEPRCKSREENEEETPEVVTIFERFEDASIMGLDLAPDGRIAAATASSQEVVTLKFDDQGGVASTKRRVRGVGDVFLRPDGQVIYVADRAGGLAAWSTVTGQAEFAPLRHAAEPVAIGQDVAGGRLFVLTSDGKVSVWDVSGQSAAALRLRDAGGVSDPSSEPQRLTANGRSLTSQDGQGRTWRLSSTPVVAEAVFPHPLSEQDEKETDSIWEHMRIYPGTNAAISRNGWTVVTLAGRSAPRIWDAGSATVKRELSETVDRARFSQAVWLSDDGAIALIQFSNATNNGPQTSFAIFDTSDRLRPTPFAPKWLLPDQVLLDVSPDLTRLLVGSGARVEIVDADSLLPIARAAGDGDVVLHARFLDGGQRLLTIDRERRYRIWNAENGLALSTPAALAADPARGQGHPTQLLDDYARIPSPRIVELDGLSAMWLPPDDKAAAGRPLIVPLMHHLGTADVKRLIGLAEALFGMRMDANRGIELFPIEDIVTMQQRWTQSQESKTTPVTALAAQLLRSRGPIESK